MTKEQYLRVIESVIKSPRNDLQKIIMLKQGFEVYVEEHDEAHWIPSQKCTVCTWEEVSYVDGYECSKCGHFEEEKEPYCNCGCKMMEEK